MSPRVYISVKIDHVKSIRRDRLWLREEKIPCEPPPPTPPRVPTEAILRLITRPNAKFIFPPKKM